MEAGDLANAQNVLANGLAVPPVHISFPCLSFTGLVIDVLYLPEIILVVSYTIFICPQAAAFSAL